MVRVITNKPKKVEITDVSSLPGLKSCWAESLGDPQVCVAILDGPVDEHHPCFQGVKLSRLPSTVSESAGQGRMAVHGTHISSVIFGQHGSPVQGIVPGCRGLIIPVFSDTHKRRLSQLNLARAINQAVDQGAHVINISGGQLIQPDAANPILTNAVQFCNDQGVLIVAATGNDGCECLHVPAALPSVLAVGAMNSQGLPFEFNNWGKTYQTQGILAPGEKILGAVPGGGTTALTGTSFATPIVSGIVALLLSIQLKRGYQPNPQEVAAAILNSALPCDPQLTSDCRRFLAGSLNITDAYSLLTEKQGVMQMSTEMGKKSRSRTTKTGKSTRKSTRKSAVGAIQPSEVSSDTVEAKMPSKSNDTSQAKFINQQEISSSQIESANQVVEAGEHAAVPMANTGMVTMPSNMVYAVPAMHMGHGINNGMVVVPSHVVATPTVPTINAQSAQDMLSNQVGTSGDCGCDSGAEASSATSSNALGSSLVYALGLLGYDFGTEARRDSFKQLMPAIDFEDAPGIPANPYDARQMRDYLRNDPTEAKSLIWTLNLELTPIYAIEPKPHYAAEIYSELVDFLDGQVQAEGSEEFIERVSIPGRLTGKTVELFSGQIVPVLEPESKRGMYGWEVNKLIDAVIDALQQDLDYPAPSEDQIEDVRYSLRDFLQKVYYDLRNLGQTSQERALNFAATNAFQYADGLVGLLKNKRRPGTGTESAQAVTMQLDQLTVEPSPFCRMDSDCWDVKIKFFDPENTDRSKRVMRYTIDVSDIMPVTMGKPRVWDVSY